MPNESANLRLTIGPVSGYDYQIGHLVSILSLTRSATVKAVKNLTVAELDFEIDSIANSIGSLLMHIGALEFFTQHFLFKEFTHDQETVLMWMNATAEELPKKLIRKNDVQFYFQGLEEVRRTTLTALASRDDKWLYEELQYGNNVKMNNYFKLFHIAEDEISHFGQIVWLKKRIQKKELLNL